MPLLEKEQPTKGLKRSDYAVFRRRRRIGGFTLVLLSTLALLGLGAYLFPGSSQQTSEEPAEQQADPAIAEQQEAPEETPEEEEKEVVEEEPPPAPPPPEDPTLFLTVPRLGLYGHTVRNDRSEWAMDLGAIKLPSTGFPWDGEGTNTYIACHRIGWPGTESYNQCLNLPSMQQGDGIFLVDTRGTVYEYRVSEVFPITPSDVWALQPIPGREVVSLQTCTETPHDWWTIGARLFEGGPESGRLVVRADRVA
jgi:sortase A